MVGVSPAVLVNIAKTEKKNANIGNFHRADPSF